MDIKKSRLYTATGDDGTTGLVGGMRVPKHSARLEAYGTVDELNSHIGLLVASLPASDDFDAERSTLRWVQHRLFDIGSALATPPQPDVTPKAGVDEQCISRLEHAIDEVDSFLPPFRKFILPGGTVAAAEAHVCRTVARRAERRITALAATEPGNPLTQRYMNRLSDYLFAAARFNNIKAAADEVFWEKDC